MTRLVDPKTKNLIKKFNMVLGLFPSQKESGEGMRKQYAVNC